MTLMTMMNMAMKLVRFDVPLDTQQVISEMNLPRQAIAPVLIIKCNKLNKPKMSKTLLTN